MLRALKNPHPGPLPAGEGAWGLQGSQKGNQSGLTLFGVLSACASCALRSP